MVVLLALALVLIGVLAWQAYRAEELHQDTAGTILLDYAELGAEELASRILQQVDYYGATPLLGFLGQRLARDATAPLPSPEELQEQPRLRQAAALATALFTLDLGVGGDVATGGAVSDATIGWLRDTVPADLGTLGDEDWRFRTLFAVGVPGDPVIIYAVTPDAGEPVTAFGVVTTTAAFGAVIDAAIHRGPLLPSALTREHSADSSTAEMVLGPDGRTLYRSAIQYPYAVTAEAPVAPHLGGLTARVAIAPGMANTLIIGGTPTRRLPLLLALFLLGASMIAAAMILWRREQTLARLRSDFVSGVSHELRTPLAQIRMFAETLQLGRVRNESEQRRSLAIIDQETRRLTHLVENLLYFSRGERQTARVERRACDLGQLVAETVSNFTPLAMARHCEIATSIEAGVVCRADPDAIRQMVLNLLDNAVKYGPQGQVVRVAVRLNDGEPGIVVEDQGPGIPPAQYAKVWRRFWRSERHHASAIAGTGIGLAIVKELADLQGARVSVESADGGGARFLVSWPRDPDADGSERPVEPHRSEDPPAPVVQAVSIE